MQIAVSYVPRDVRAAVRVAEAAHRGGLAFLGIADTPQLRDGAFPTIQHVLASTTQLGVGTFVTNPVLRHPCVLAADFAILERLYPGRVVAGIGSGDSAVRSVGLRPATSVAVAEAARTIRDRAGGAVRVLVAASGPRMASTIPPEADGIVIGGGLDPHWLARMIDAAEQAAGHRLERWAFAVGGPLADRAGDDVDVRRVLTSVVTVSRHALSVRPGEREVPARLAGGLQEIYAGYDVGAYGDPDGVNARLLAEYPEERAYLLERFAVLGDAEIVSARLAGLETKSGLDGVVLTTNVKDPLTLVEDIGRKVLPRLSSSARGNKGGPE